VAFAAWLALTVAYLLWRAAYSLNPEAPLWSALFLALEAFAALSAATFYATVLERPRREPPPVAPPLTVDVFVCTYNESLSLVRQTLRRAIAMEHPHRTFLLDDGDRPEARALARELGCGYLARGENVDFKAGNLNHALGRTRGDLVVVLDADHLVRREFLSRLIGYFADPAVALVQTPQVFYNLDSFQHHFRASARRLWHEGAVFHHAMQPGADRWNGAFFVGTGAILRRSALERIGGFATGSVTEDAFTSMRLHAAGYRSVHHDEPLGYLLAPESLLQYLTQRLRWGQGSMQILRRENPLFRPGLSPAQRMTYFMALSSFAQSIVHLAYYLAPAVFLLGGPAPLRAQRPVEILPILAHVALDLAAFKLFLGPLARPLLSECYKFLNLYAYLKSLGGYFSAGRLRFQVTNKGRDAGASLRLLAPQLALLTLNATAFGWGTLRIASAPSLGDALGLVVATAFAGFFVVVGSMTALYAWERMASRAEHAFVAHVPADLQVGEARDRAVAVRLNQDALRAVLPGMGAALRPGMRVALALDLEDGAPPLRASGEVRSVRWTRAPRQRSRANEVARVIEVGLDPLPTAAADRLHDHLAGRALPHFVDSLLAVWGSGPRAGDRAERPSLTGTYYLPVETSLL
jgi:cellulose synthase (UDP-forming)